MEENLTTGTTDTEIEEVVTELVSEISEVEEFVTTETTTVTTADLSNLASVDVDLLNRFLYIGTSFIIACLFWFVCKMVYRLFAMFF